MSEDFELIIPSEKEDFENSLKKFGYNPEDFKLKEENQTVFDGNNISPIQGKVTAINKRTGKEKTYEASNLSS